MPAMLIQPNTTPFAKVAVDPITLDDTWGGGWGDPLKLEVDEEATTAEIGASRPPLQMFERGGTIEQIKAAAKSETGFDPPSAPRWPHWAKTYAVGPITAVAAE